MFVKLFYDFFALFIKKI